MLTVGQKQIGEPRRVVVLPEDQEPLALVLDAVILGEEGWLEAITPDDWERLRELRERIDTAA